MASLTAKALELLDKSFVVIVWVWTWITTHKWLAATAAVTVTVALGAWRLAHWLASRKAVVSQEVPNNPAREFARESARKIAESLDAGPGNELLALRLATEGVVLARVARELAPDVDKLSKELGVDMIRYQTYSRQVLADAEQKFKY